MKNIILPDLTLANLQQLYLVLDVIKNGVIITDEHSNIVYANPAYEQMTGYAAANIIGQNPGMMRSGYHNEKFYKNIWNALKEIGFWEGEIWNRKKSGSVYPVLITINRLQSQTGKLNMYLAVLSDITFLKLKDAEDLNLFYYDFLTCLPNKYSLEDHFNKIGKKFLDMRFKYSEEKVSNKIAFIYIKLNGLSAINEQYGFVTGDKLLTAVAKRLHSIVSKNDALGRIGGDEFLAIVPGIHLDTEIKRYCNNIINDFLNPYNVDDINIQLSCTIGVSSFPTDADSYGTLVQKAKNSLQPLIT